MNILIKKNSILHGIGKGRESGILVAAQSSFINILLLQCCYGVGERTIIP